MNANGARTRYYTRHILQYTKSNLTLILLGILFLAGVLCATLLLGGAGEQARDYVLRMVDGFARNKLSRELRDNFIASLASSMAFLGVIFACGFCAIAQPAIVIVPFFRGLGLGYSLAGLYSHYGTSAMGFTAIYTVSSCFSAIAMLLGCIEALRLSTGLLGAMRTGERGAFYPVRRYLGRFLACTLLCVFSAALESILYAVFANYVVLS